MAASLHSAVRTMGNDPAKYKNSRETPLFDKSLVLYGFQGARTVMRKKSRAIVAEGYMDVLQLWNYGFTESVACLGTALTLPQLRQISKFNINRLLAIRR